MINYQCNKTYSYGPQFRQAPMTESEMNVIHFLLRSTDDISREEDRLCAEVDTRKYWAHQFLDMFRLNERTRGNIHDMIDEAAAVSKYTIHLMANEERMRRMY